MLGARNTVMSQLRCKQPALVSLHCHCHIAALIANEACKVLPDELENLTTDVWYYFLKSPRRLRQFEELQIFAECMPHKLLKACQTWWPSLKASVNHLIEQYEALFLNFRCTEDKQAVLRRVRLYLKNLWRNITCFFHVLHYQLLTISTGTCSSNLQFFMFSTNTKISFAVHEFWVHVCCWTCFTWVYW